MKIKVTLGDAAAREKPAAPPPAAPVDEVSRRALANAEVQRFRDLFGGEVRAIRNLKE
jgi:hypothetical protein